MSTKRIAKPTGWVVDMRHYLDEGTGDLPEGIPERLLNLAVFFGALVAWVTDHLPEDDWLTNVPCRRSPGVDGAAARSSPNSTGHLDRSFGIVRFAATTV